jgi:hypothetical protein
VGYVEQAVLARDPGFLDQLRVAVATAAVAIQGEALAGHDSSQYQKRQQLATAVLANIDGLLGRFVWPVVQNAAIVRGAPISIASSTNANPIVVTTAAAHGLTTGAVVEITGHLVNTAANGSWTATNLTSTTFSIPAVGNGVGTASGQAVKLPIDSDIQFQVNSVWDDLAGITITD